MTYLEAFEIIKMKLKQTSRANVIENGGSLRRNL